MTVSIVKVPTTGAAFKILDTVGRHLRIGLGIRSFLKPKDLPPGVGGWMETFDVSLVYVQKVVDFITAVADSDTPSSAAPGEAA